MMWYKTFRSSSLTYEVATISDFDVEIYKKKGKDPGIEISEAISISQFHQFILYPDCLTIVSNVTKEIVHSIATFASTEKMKGLEMNYATKRVYLFSFNNLYELTIINEEENFWNQYLEAKDYNKALENCKNDEKARLYIYGLAADNKFENSNFGEAAQIYLDSDRSFEEVVLKYMYSKASSNQANLLDNTRKKAIKKLLKSKFNSYVTLKNSENMRNAFRIQKPLLTSWMLEINIEQRQSSKSSLRYIETI